MKSKFATKTSASRFSSQRLLQKITAGNLTKKEAREIARVLERRFPTPVPNLKEAA